MADQGQKTEQPTQRRIEKARKEGQFPSSREFVSAVQLLTFITLVVFYGPNWFEGARRAMRGLLLAGFHTQLSRSSAARLAWEIASEMLWPLVAAGGLLALVSLAAQLGITGLGVSTSKIAPDLKRLSPASRLKNIFRQNVSQFFQALVMLPLFCHIVWLVARRDAESFLRLPLIPLENGLALVAASIEGLLWKAGGLFLVIGAIDLVRQRRRWKSGLKMSKQDIREEMKEVEGDPHTKMRIRRLQRDLSRRRMMKDVETATAVVVNPTHFAVALRYVPSEMPAPKVVAKGKNYLALRIRDRARSHQVPIVENPPLAQALYKAAQVGQDIPPHLYRAVAEVLAYIYRLMHGRPPR